MSTYTEASSMPTKSSENAALTKKALPFMTNVAYGCGDMACNVVYGMVGSLITLFYTDYAGVTAAAVGLVMVLSRIFDGFSDMVMGFVVQHTKSKWGAARCWVLWTAVPYGVGAVLLFLVPQTNATAQFWYVFLTYNLATTVFYTMVNVPYGTLASLMTRNAHGRDILSVFRMGLSPIGRIIAVVFTMPVVKLFGDDQMAWAKTMGIWAIIAVFLLFFCFSRCEETVQIKPDNQKKIGFVENLKGLARNKYFWTILILWTVQASYNTVVGTVLPYYCKYILKNDTWMYSILYFLEIVLLVIGVFCIPMLLRTFSKRTLTLAGSILAIGGQLLFMLNPHNFAWMTFTTILRALGTAPLNALICGMMGEVIEYGQWKNHFRQDSLIYSGSCMGLKFGMGAVGGVIAVLMTSSGFVSSTAGGAVQPQSALNMIQQLYAWGPIILWGIAALVLFLYRLEKDYPSIVNELTEREARGEV